MSQDKYPLIKRCFPECHIFHSRWNTYSINAEDLERELEKAVRVYGTNLNDNGIAAGDDPQWFLSIKREKNDTHTALLIGVEPIQKDTAESLLRDIVNSYWATPEQHNQLIERAKRLLEGK